MQTQAVNLLNDTQLTNATGSNVSTLCLVAFSAFTTTLVVVATKALFVAVQGDLDVLEPPPCKKPKLEIPPLDLLSSPPFRVSPPTADSHLSTPSALLPPPSASTNTPMDAATCDWADNLLATAHRPTPTARVEAKLTSVSCLKPGADAKPSPVAFRLGNPGSSGFLSPPNRFLASVSKGSHPSRLGFASPSGGSNATPARGSINPFASPQVGSAAIQGAFRQPLQQGASTRSQGQGQFPPQKIRGIPMQPLRPQNAPAPPSLGMQSPSFRTRAGPGPVPVLPSQDISRQPCLQGPPQLSMNTLSNTVSLVTAQSALTNPASSRQQFTVTTGASNSQGISRPPHSITQSLFGKPASAVTIAGSFPSKVSPPEPASGGSAQSSFPATTAATAATGRLGPSTGMPAFPSGIAKSIMALPTGVLPVSHGAQMPSRTPSFMDSVAAFTEGFALTHTEPGTLGDWALGSKTELHGTGFAKDALEMFQLEAGMNSDISDDSLEQMWKIPAEMLVSDTDDLGY